jgi:DNA ligase-1
MHTPRRTLLLTLLGGLLPWRGASAAAALQLPTVYDPAIDPAPYLVSEKYDGVRGYWDGGTLRYRSGRVVPAPAWFTARLPRTPLDGELWLGRGRFDELSGIVRKATPVDAEWRQVRYMVFEMPAAPGTFAERARHLRELTSQVAWPQLEAVEQAPSGDRDALRRRLAQTVAMGGEGLVLHLASAPYRAGRSDVTMKLKPELDAEAIVVALHQGEGRYAGLLGALEVQAPDGRRFLLGSGFSESQRRSPPAVGSVVTYRYRALTPSGAPRFATFVRVHEAL